MRGPCLFGLALFTCLNTWAQEGKHVVAIAPLKMNTFYLCIDNPIRVAVSEIPDSALIIEILGDEDATIRRSGNFGQPKNWVSAANIDRTNKEYLVNVTKVGEVIVKVSKINYNGKIEELGREKFNCKLQLLPRVTFMNLDGISTITRSRIKIAVGLKVASNRRTLTVISFSLTTTQMVNAEQVKRSFSVVGTRLTNAMEANLESLKRGDTIQFEKIILENCAGNLRSSENISLTVW